MNPLQPPQPAACPSAHSPIAWLRSAPVIAWLQLPSTQQLSVAEQARRLRVPHGSLHAYLRDELRLRGTARPAPVHHKAAAGEIRTWESRGQPVAQIKVNGRWQRAGRYTWEQAHGPVPAGYKVIHADKDRSHYALGNLRLVPAREVGRLCATNGRDLCDGYVAATLGERHLPAAARRQQAHLLRQCAPLISLKRAQLLLSRAILSSRHA